MIVRHPDIKRRRNSGESYSLDKRRNSVSGGFLGTYSIKSIAKKLDRTVNAIKLKANRIGLSDAVTFQWAYSAPTSRCITSKL